MVDDIPPYCRALRDRYTFERELGRGGMAIVWLARERRHDRRVAVKFLRPELASAMGQDRFVREIRYAAGLSHPNILPLLDSGSLPDDSVLPGLPYYVMPFVDGESLRDRLERERSLPIPDALDIVRNVAAALDHAHARNLIHRDIKPGNILLTGGVAVVADFGIARAADRAATSEERTSEGLALGTPQYMPPEQVDGRSDLDGRADIYALGCVLYEMLAGDPPFTGSTPAAVMARQRFDTPPPIRVVRDTVPLAVERAVAKALAKQQGDRFATAGEFARALVSGSGEQPAITAPPGWRARAGRLAPFGAAVAMVALAMLVPGVRERTLEFLGGLLGKEPLITAGAPPVDTTRYAVLPFVYSGEMDSPLFEDQVLRDALAHWDGITVADPFQVREAVARWVGEGESPRSTRAARRIAREVGAGRYLRGEVSRHGDSVRVRAGLYDVNTDALLSDRTVWLDARITGVDQALMALADSLVLRGVSGQPRGLRVAGTRSLPALQAFARGQRAIERWELETAAADFEAAIGYDPGYVQAELWRALSQRWSGEPPAAWRSAATLAVAGSSQLSSRDSAVAQALVALADDRDDAACRTWAGLTRAAAYDFVAWFGWADCLRRDNAVVRDRRSPSGWSFRTSHQAALNAYQRAFALLPSIHRALRGRGDRTIRGIFKTQSIQIRDGYALAPDTGRYIGRIGWAADTVTFTPYPALEMMQGHAWTMPDAESVARALRAQRELFHTTAASWVSAAPTSAGALETLAQSLELLGDPTALDTLRRARILASDARERLQLAAAEVLMLARRALPDDTAGLRAAIDLADSILRRESPAATTDPFSMATLAALRGRPQLAAAYARRPEVSQIWQVPRPLVETAPALVIYAALCAPADSLAPLQRRVATAIGRDVAPGERAPSRLRWLALAASLAWPDHALPGIDELAGAGDFVVDAMSALRQGDSLQARSILEEAARRRRAMGNEAVTLDALPAMASLHASVGRRDQAKVMLDASLSLYGLGAEALDDPLRAGALIRSVVQAAELAAGSGDSAGARRWARAGVVLGSGTDLLLQPLISRARRLAD